MFRIIQAILTFLGLLPKPVKTPIKLTRPPMIGVSKEGAIDLVWLPERQPVRHMTAIMVEKETRPRDSPAAVN